MPELSRRDLTALLVTNDVLVGLQGDGARQEALPHLAALFDAEIATYRRLDLRGKDEFVLALSR